ncbi:MAG: thioesterase family protein [Candidatus Promineifilaceae bacterium]
MPTIEEVQQLTRYWQQTIPSDYLDRMGHVNIQYYFRLYDTAATHLFDAFGMTETYVDEHQNGAFALEQHIRYLAEIHEGDRVSIYMRVIAQSPKRVHFAGFIVNDTHQRLASMFESLGTHADLVARRTTPFPPALAENIRSMLAADSQLAWDVPLSGSIHA